MWPTTFLFWFKLNAASTAAIKKNPNPTEHYLLSSKQQTGKVSKWLAFHSQCAPPKHKPKHIFYTLTLFQVCVYQPWQYCWYCVCVSSWWHILETPIVVRTTTETGVYICYIIRLQADLWMQQCLDYMVCCSKRRWVWSDRERRVLMGQNVNNLSRLVWSHCKMVCSSLCS